MIDHISIGVRDLAVSGAFYDTVLAPLGYRRMADEAATIGWGKKHPEFWVNARPGMTPVAADTGTHICLRAPDEDAVRAFYKAALAAGGSDDGGPGLRPEYHATYYAAFARDPDGNRIEVVTFLNET
jgi:catechol 2,3-dioxygenase-like lactoylglutathione lyase family enzyme